jgi:hypothetical protein
MDSIEKRQEKEAVRMTYADHKTISQNNMITLPTNAVLSVSG